MFVELGQVADQPRIPKTPSPQPAQRPHGPRTGVSTNLARFSDAGAPRPQHGSRHCRLSPTLNCQLQLFNPPRTLLSLSFLPIFFHLCGVTIFANELLVAVPAQRVHV